METHTPPVKHVSGKRVVTILIIFVLLLSTYVAIRIVQVSGPGPDPDTIPKRPGRTSTG
ncbi:MAG: hypothetical protein HKN21_13040 [Candidatus Eisenbacteria bacterium]|uniref:Uncharacterized protein n=1 Tax=Eiseniibacteriota bacterium TaxID=2212470 RepID=A0A7Y2E9G2_UNCEI|nr:hypothetical protein [Candidatus Eisenbacteria bacterium]